MTFDEWADSHHLSDPLDRYKCKKAWDEAQRQILLDTVFSVDQIESKFNEVRMKTEIRRQKTLLM